VTLQGKVSETVVLSVSPNSTHDNVEMDVVSSGSSLRITLSGDGKSPEIRLPLLVRSNSSFSISGVVESTTAELTDLLIADEQPTGTLVSRNAITGLNTSPHPSDLSRPFLVATGPRVSLGGTLNSPNNALEITVLIRLRPGASPWTIQLNFVATRPS